MTIYEFLQQQKKDTADLFNYIHSFNPSAISVIEDYTPSIKYSVHSFNHTSTLQILKVEGIEPTKFGHARIATFRNTCFIIVPTWCLYLKEVHKGIAVLNKSDFSELINSITPSTQLSADSKGINKVNEVEIYPGEALTCTGDTPMWHLREYSRLQDGTYASLPEAALSILTNEQRSALASVFAHISKTPGLLAYTSSPEKGLRDIQTPIRPGRLLKRLFPSVSDELVREFSKHFSVLEGLTLHSSTDEEDFERVYLECENTGSCMAHPASYWGLYVRGKLYHPVRAYAFDSVCVLWVTDSDGQIIGRTVGNKYSKEYVRVYYNEEVLNSRNKVELMLEKEGWTHNEYALEGCEIARVEDSKGRIICPYIDGIAGVTVCDNLLIVGGSNHTTASECILDWEPEPEFPCGNCGSEAGEDYELSIDGELLCQCCVQREYTSAFDLYGCEFVYVPDGDNRMYTLMSDLCVGNYNLIHGDRVVNVNKTDDVVVLSPVYYDGAKVCAATEEAVVASNGAVLTDDLEQLGLFYNQQSDELCLVDEYRILNNELVYVGPYFMEPLEWQLDFRTKLYLIPVLAYSTLVSAS